MGKLTNFTGAAFDPVVMRWYYGNTEQYKIQSEVFKSGYEDPTYMTFRVEFGEWGASILHKNTFTMHGGYVLNALHQDYDQLPNGLLDLHFVDSAIFSQYPYYSFNKQTYYNAYNYLLQRNEDTRAEYLKAFVTGLYEIQKDHPYLFQSISGLDNLNNFSPESGQRLNKDTFINIECIEGLSLKIKTLLQLYRKAAWDDAWQRWVLPLNMRQFKMIIYVFERRTFQKVTQASPITGIKEPHEVNYDIPVYAYECNPCEFVIKNTWNGEYDATWGNDAEKTQITIRVNNVMTYFRNGLLQDKLNNLLIYDLFDAMDRSKSIEFSNADVNQLGQLLYMTPNEAKGNFLKKGTILENEDLTTALKAPRIDYGTGEDIDGESAMADLYYREMMNNILPHSLLNEHIKANWWHEATVEGRDYWSSMKGWDGLFGGNTWKNIGRGLLNIITAATTQIRVSQNYSTHNSAVFYNILDYIDIEGSPAEETYSMATDFIMPMRKDLKHDIDEVTRGETSWATREIGKGKFRDQHIELDNIDSVAMTENDYSWATDDNNAEGDHDWTKYKNNPNKRQKQPFNWNKIDSSLMTGGDYSWATTDYNATGQVKGNDWTNAGQYKTSEVPRQKNGFNWNNIDSKTLTGDDFSWATDDKNNQNDHKWEDFDKDHMIDGQRQKAEFNWNKIDREKLSEGKISKATDNRNIQDTLDVEHMTEYDFSWATKGEGKHEHDPKMQYNKMDATPRQSAIDGKIESGLIDSDALTNYDKSWATLDLDNVYDHSVKIRGGIMDTSTREMNDNIQVSLDDERMDVSNHLLKVDDKKRKQNNDIISINIDTSRGFLDTFGKTTYNDRKINKEISLLPQSERELSDIELRQPDESERALKDEILFDELKERELHTDIVEVELKERTLDKPVFTDIDESRELPDTQFNEIQDARNINSRIQMKLESERNIIDNVLNIPLEERVMANNIQETDYHSRTINANIEPLEFIDRPQKTDIQQNEESARQLPEYQINQNVLQERQIIDQALRQPDKELIHPNYSLTGIDNHQRGINDNSYFSLQNTERYINNTIQAEHIEGRVINEQLLRKLNGTERHPNDIVLNRLDVLNYISKATTVKFNKEFLEVDQESSRIDATAKEMLQNAEAFKSLQYDERMKDDDITQVLAFAKAYSDESDAMKNAFINRIQGLQKELKEQTYNAVRDIPEMEYQTVTEDAHEKQEPILLNVEQITQIKNNIKLANLSDAEVRDLSYKGLISLHDTLENNIVKTIILQHPETVDDRSIATDLDNPPKPIINGNIEEKENDYNTKIANGKVEDEKMPHKDVILNGKLDDSIKKNQADNITNGKVDQHVEKRKYNLSNSRVDESSVKKHRPILGHKLDDNKYEKEGQ